MASRRLIRRWGVAIIFVVGLLIAFIPAPIVFSAPVERTIRIEARSFQYTPEVVHVNPGDRVTLELSSADYVHGLYLDGYDLNLVADPGQTARLTFTADRTGSFRMRCSVTCGALHPFMIGKFNVGSNDLLWRALGLAALAAFAGIWWVRR
jgi:cytochrome c oxidase subunit 2